MKRIKSVDIYGTVYTIEWLDDSIKVGDDEYIEGECKSIERKIKVCTGHKNKSFSEEDIENIFYHELIHAILIEGQYIGYGNDEPLVEWLAKCIRHLKKQNVL